MVRPFEIRRFIRDFLREELEDPLPERTQAGLMWIQDDWPRINSSFPRIGMHELPILKEPSAVGTPERHERLILQIIVMVEKGQKIDINNDNAPEPAEDICDFLANKIIEAMQKGVTQGTFYNEFGFEHFVNISETPVDPTTTDNVFQKNLDYLIIYTR